ncbi:MAG: PTS sugar transporter subunit IIA [Mariprofundaceae bacterium]
MGDHQLIISEDAIQLDSQASSKRGLIAEIIKCLPSIDAKMALEVVMAREQLGSTGIGHGVAIPHGRLADLVEPVIGLVRHIDGIDFDAIDGHPVHIVIVLIAPADENRAHLELLAKIARLLQRDDIRHAIMQAENEATVAALFSSSA